MEDEKPEEIEAFKGQATGSAVWSSAGHAAQQLIRLGSNLILTRLLLADYFGLMALVGVVLAGVQLFSDLGISSALIQSKRSDRRFTDTLWTIQAIRGVLLWLVAAALAGPIGAFYEEPLLPDLIRVAAFALVFSGFQSSNVALHNRQLRIKPIVMLEMGSQLFGVVAMVVWASISPTVWSLVVGGLVTSAVSAAASHVVLSGRQNRFCLDKEAAVELYLFGRWIFLSTMLMFIYVNGDRIVFGKLVTMSVLGVYSIALNLAVVPSAIISRLGSAVIFPLYSRFYRSGAELPSIYRNARLPMLIVGGWGISGIVAGGPTIIRILYDSRYWEAGWMMQILAVGLWFRALESSNGAAILALGQTRWSAIGSASKIVGMAICIPIGWRFGEFPGALLGLAASDVILYLASLIGVITFKLDDRRTDFGLTLRLATSSVAGFYAVDALTRVGWDNVFLHALVIALVVTAIWAPLHRKIWLRYKETGHVFFAEEPQLALKEPV